MIFVKQFKHMFEGNLKARHNWYNDLGIKMTYKTNF